LVASVRFIVRTIKRTLKRETEILREVKVDVLERRLIATKFNRDDSIEFNDLLERVPQSDAVCKAGCCGWCGGI